MTAPNPLPGDDALLDEIFALAIDACAGGQTIDLDALLDGREHLRAEALRMIEMARDVGFAKAPRATTRHAPEIAGFTILEEVGRGGMGIVYRARQVSLGREVALKVLAPAMLASARARQRFALEARALARLQHPHVVAVHEIIVQDELCAYAMEWVDGTTLARAIDAGDARFDVIAIARLGATMAHALAAVHDAGLVHRDVKPSNILLRADGSPVLSDFGLVRDDEHSMHTATGEFLGTAAYAAPELLRGEHDRVGAFTDVYGLGVTLYAALTGSTPFVASSAASMLRRIEEGRGTPIQVKNPKVPRDLATVVTKAIDRDALRRYATATEFAADLERFLAFEPILAQPAGLALRVQRWLERSPQLALAMAALLVTLTAGLGVSAWLAVDLGAQRTAAQAAEAVATARQREFDQVAAVVLREQVIAAERHLHPPWPAQIEAMERWLREDAGPLLARRAGIEQTLADLRSRARPTQDRYILADEAQQFLHDTLDALLVKLDLLAAEECKAVEQRLAWARCIGPLSRQHPNARVTWDQAREAIAAADGVAASELYRVQRIELRDADVIGLVPIGRNPATNLWEFYDLRSAWDGSCDPATIPIPAHVEREGTTGHIDVGEYTGIVFVLLPGGRFTMGAQAGDLDADGGTQESPHEVVLAPFFLALHELTQGQWRRLSGGQTPSHYPAGSSNFVGGLITWSHPVEQVDWAMSATLLTRHGMTLPTEAQWEYGCRAGTATPWWTGPDRETLCGAANLGDQSAKKAGANWAEIADWPSLEDGFMVHAPVDALRPNPFGLHHVHGNVWEWCADRFGPYSLPARASDGLREVPEGASVGRVPRGGSFTNAARGTRSAHRRDYTPTLRYFSLGLRAARVVMRD